MGSLPRGARAPIRTRRSFSADNFVSSRAAARRIRGYRDLPTLTQV